MITIGAKELRTKLDNVLERVLAGEDIVVKHRFKEPVRLSPVNFTPHSDQPLAGLHAFDVAAKRPSPYSDRKPLKELYNESLTTKYSRHD